MEGATSTCQVTAATTIPCSGEATRPSAAPPTGGRLGPPPKPLGSAVLVGLRSELRKRNLHDTTNRPPPTDPPEAGPRPADLSARTINGAFNDLDQPAMGDWARFGRNLPIDQTWRSRPTPCSSPAPGRSAGPC